MEDSTTRSGIAKLDLNNHHIWQVQVKCWLVTKGLFKHTQETDVDDTDGDAKALAHISMTLTEQHLPTFMECGTAKAAWDAFASLFKSKSQARRLQLKAELSSLRKESGEPLVKYFARAKHLKAQLISVGTAMDEQEMCLSVLNGLPEEYSILSTVLSASDKELTLQDMLARLLMVENKVSRPAAESKAYVARPGGAPTAKGQSRGSGLDHRDLPGRKPESVITAASLATSRRTAGSASGRSKAPTTDLKVSGLKAQAGEGHKATWPVQRPWKDKVRHGCLIREHPPTSL